MLSHNGFKSAHKTHDNHPSNLNRSCSIMSISEIKKRRKDLNFHLDEERMNHAVNSRAETEADVLSTAGWLFPQEEIADVAKMVKTCKTISRATVEEYGRPCEAALAGKGIHIVDFPVYTLTDIHRKELEELYKGRPYGDVQLTARMVVRK